MIKRFCIIGSHGCGKTTLSYILAAFHKKLGRSVKIIQEVARSCPYPLNEGMTKEACLWIFHEHMKKELEAMQKFDTIICDRSAIDSFMYAKAQNCFDKTDFYTGFCFDAANEWMSTYDKIIYVKPGSVKPMEDGVRSTDIAFQKRVEKEFDDWIINKYSTHKITVLMSDQIFDEVGIIKSLYEMNNIK